MSVDIDALPAAALPSVPGDTTADGPAYHSTLVERLESAMSREGKPRGDHMIAAHQAIHDAWKDSDQPEARDLANLASGNVHAIRAETAMFDGLRVVAEEAAVALRFYERVTNMRPVFPYRPSADTPTARPEEAK